MPGKRNNNRVYDINGAVFNQTAVHKRLRGILARAREDEVSDDDRAFLAGVGAWMSGREGNADEVGSVVLVKGRGGNYDAVVRWRDGTDTAVNGRLFMIWEREHSLLEGTAEMRPRTGAGGVDDKIAPMDSADVKILNKLRRLRRADPAFVELTEALEAAQYAVLRIIKGETTEYDRKSLMRAVGLLADVRWMLEPDPQGAILGPVYLGGLVDTRGEAADR